MKQFLQSVLFVIGLMSAILVAMTVFVGRFERFVLQLSNTWHRLKTSENLHELGTDVAAGAGVVFSPEESISWGLVTTFIIVTLISAAAWHRLVRLPRVAEKKKMRSKLAKGKKERKAASNDT